MNNRLSDDEREALREFATLGISVTEFLHRMRDKIVLGEFRPGYREINVAAFQNEIINVTGEEIRWVVQRYLHRRMSGEELSNWAGLMLAIAAYVLPANESDDELLALLNDVALPLGNEYLDRETLKRRLG
ncbi:MAG TPA: hypothetical protein VLC46_25335 [Thermoanaerobaculia bacterium]|jgi:hypothetical protein|nr:hypothetical protein [Thermoanaerobaculia bacterium]